MLTKIELTNFMSHAHTVIEPAAGLTVLVGPNNCGKSAVVAALQIACHNDNSTYVMRHGERECSVAIETSDGHTVRWKRKTSPSYEIDGQLFDRLGRGTLPDQLHQALKLSKVDGGDDTSFDIHFGCQKSPIFLLDKPATAAAKFFASSSDAIRLVEMQRRHQDKNREMQREKTQLEAASRQLNAELEALQPVIGLDQRLKASEAAHQALTQLAADIAKLETQASLLEKQGSVVFYHAAQAQGLARLESPPLILAIEPVAALLGQIAGSQRDYDLVVAQGQAMADLPIPPPLPDTLPLQNVVKNLQDLGDSISQAAAAHHLLLPLSPPPRQSETAHLEDLLLRLQDTNSVFATESNRSQSLDLLAPPSQPAAEQHLFQLVIDLARAEQAARSAGAQLAICRSLSAPALPPEFHPLLQLIADFQSLANSSLQLQTDLSRIESDRTALAAEIRLRAPASVCTQCGAPLDPERLLAGVALHQEHSHD